MAARRERADPKEANVSIRAELQEACGPHADLTPTNLVPAWKALARLIPVHSRAKRPFRITPGLEIGPHKDIFFLLLFLLNSSKREMLRTIGRGALEKVAAGLGVGAGQTATRHMCSRAVPQLGSLLARKRSFTIGLESALSAFQRPLPISTGLRGIATDASTNEPAEVPKKARKAMTWYGMRISTDPTAPSVIRRRPTTPSQRHTALIDKTYLWRGKPLKALTKGIRSTGGRNNQGVVTVWGKGGGNKRRYRLIDFKRAIFTSKGVVAGTVERIEWDPNRTAMIALLRHKSVEGYTGAEVAAFSYIVCPRGIAVGNELVASRSEPLDVKPGNAMQLRFIPVGTLVHNVEMHPGQYDAPFLPALRLLHHALWQYKISRLLT